MSRNSNLQSIIQRHLESHDIHGPEVTVTDRLGNRVDFVLSLQVHEVNLVYLLKLADIFNTQDIDVHVGIRDEDESARIFIHDAVCD